MYKFITIYRRQRLLRYSLLYMTFLHHRTVTTFYYTCLRQVWPVWSLRFHVFVYASFRRCIQNICRRGGKKKSGMALYLFLWLFCSRYQYEVWVSDRLVVQAENRPSTHKLNLNYFSKVSFTICRLVGVGFSDLVSFL